mmetsp:Transcript_14926/g.18773  ORF Transcript_14926/g.18773 Transcript_14926/m.18773 type:complete len:278 (+) Transcript_14926:1471-2304(+)
MNQARAHRQKCVRVGVADILVQESADQFRLRALVQVARQPLIFLHEALVSFLKIRCARAINDQLLRLEFVVLGSLLQQHLLKLLFVEFARVFAHLNQHLDRHANLSLLDDFSAALMADLLHQKANQTFLDCLILNHVVLKLTILHVLDQGQVELRHVVFVHVEQDVSDHHDALLDLFPDAVELSEELLVVSDADIVCDRSQQLHSGLLDGFVKHGTVLVEHQVVGSAVKLLVAERACLLVVDLIDRVLDRLPVLLRLVSLHVCVAHFVSVNQKLVGR